MGQWDGWDIFDHNREPGDWSPSTFRFVSRLVLAVLGILIAIALVRTFVGV